MTTQPCSERLTPREQDVLELLRRGLTDQEIADLLGVSRKAISHHVSEILGKLEVRNRYEAAAWPERPPWWMGAFAPIGLWWKRTLSGLTSSAGMLANAVAVAVLGVVLGGAAAMVVLIAGIDRTAEPEVANAVVAPTRTPVQARADVRPASLRPSLINSISVSTGAVATTAGEVTPVDFSPSINSLPTPTALARETPDPAPQAPDQTLCQPAGGIIRPEVRTALASADEVVVVVSLCGLELPGPGDLDEDLLEQRRRQVAEVQNRVLSKLEPSDFTLTYRYDVTFALAGLISASGVEKLEGHPDVEVVALSTVLCLEIDGAECPLPMPTPTGGLCAAVIGVDCPPTSGLCVAVIIPECPWPTSVPASAPCSQVPCDQPVDCYAPPTSVSALLVLQYDAGLTPDVPCPDQWDMNGDSEINAVDAHLILRGTLLLESR